MVDLTALTSMDLPTIGIILAVLLVIAGAALYFTGNLEKLTEKLGI